MSSYRRLYQPGGTWFFTVCLAERGTHQLVEHVDLLRTAYVETMRALPVTCHAMVILPDHLHAVWTLPEGDTDYPLRWRLFKARFTHLVDYRAEVSSSKKRKRERGLWQRRYWEHMIRSDRERAAAMEYCHQNPVKHGLVPDPADWAYSTLHRDLHAAGRGSL